MSKSIDNIYKLYKSELLSGYKNSIIDHAVYVWKKEKRSYDFICEHIGLLGSKLEGASKKEFIAIMLYYRRRFFSC